MATQQTAVRLPSFVVVLLAVVALAHVVPEAAMGPVVGAPMVRATLQRVAHLARVPFRHEVVERRRRGDVDPTVNCHTPAVERATAKRRQTRDRSAAA